MLGCVPKQSFDRLLVNPNIVYQVPGRKHQVLNASTGPSTQSKVEQEAMRLLERGYDVMKFFPAEASGGAKALKAIGGPLPQISFCPTGGVSTGNLNDYLSLPNVLCAGGSWVAPRGPVDVDKVASVAREAAGLTS